MGAHMPLGDRMTRIQTTLGVRDDVHLVTMLKLTDFLDTLLNIRTVVFYGREGLLIPIINDCTIFRQNTRNPTPVIHIF